MIAKLPRDKDKNEKRRKKEPIEPENWSREETTSRAAGPDSFTFVEVKYRNLESKQLDEPKWLEPKGATDVSTAARSSVHLVPCKNFQANETLLYTLGERGACIALGMEVP